MPFGSMLEETNIDCEKSLATGYLQIRPFWLERIEMISFLTASILFAVYPLFFYPIIDYNNPNETFLAFSILPLCTLAGIFLFYKKLREKKLVLIQTNSTQGQNRALTAEFMKLNGYSIRKNNSNLIIGIVPSDIVSWKRQINVLFDGNKVFVCVLTLSPRVRRPSFFTAKELTADISRYILRENHFSSLNTIGSV